MCWWWMISLDHDLVEERNDPVQEVISEDIAWYIIIAKEHSELYS